MWTDTHCHLATPALAHKLPEILAQAAAADVCGMIVPAISPDDWAQVVQLHTLPAVRAAAVGIHPWFAAAFAGDEYLARLDALLQQHSGFWMGEIGLDFHPAHAATREIQTELCRAQIDLAQRHRRPLILHNLKAGDSLLRLIKNVRFTQGGIVHAFSGSLEEARQWLQHGFKIGIGSLLLNPNAKKARQAAALLPIDALVLETDAPFMLGSQTNTPANTAKIAAVVAELRHISLTGLAAACERNLTALGIPPLS